MRLDLSRCLVLFVTVVGLIDPSTSAAVTCHDLFKSARIENRALINQTAKRIDAYRKSMNDRILERDYVIEPFLISLVAKEHMLLIGPPGNAKTTLAKLLMTNIVDAKDRSTSFYSMQMNKEITLSDTHGGVNFKDLSNGVIRRNYHEGLLGAKLGFIDEAFDVRPGAFRNILDILAERAHSQGTSHHIGLTETVVAATNRTLGEVYSDFNNSEQPRALIDRFAFVLFVPKEMELRTSDRQIFKGQGDDAKPIQTLTFQDIDVVRALTADVVIPTYISDIAATIHYRLTPQFEAREVKALNEYREKVRNGEHALPPYRAAKYLSPRTLAKAGSILRAIVALDYVAKNGQRELVATVEDISKLRSFYQLGGPSNHVLNAQMGRASKEFEKDQIKSVKLERDIVDPMFDSILKEFNESLQDLKLHELDQAVRDFAILSPDLRHRLTKDLKAHYIDGLKALNSDLKDDVSPKTIAALASHDIIKDHLETLWPGRSQQIANSWATDAGFGEAKISKRRQIKQARKSMPRPAVTPPRATNASTKKTTEDSSRDQAPSKSSETKPIFNSRLISLKKSKSDIAANFDGSSVFEFEASANIHVQPQPFIDRILYGNEAPTRFVVSSSDQDGSRRLDGYTFATNGTAAYFFTNSDYIYTLDTRHRDSSGKPILGRLQTGFMKSFEAVAMVPGGEHSPSIITFESGRNLVVSHQSFGKVLANGYLRSSSGIETSDLRNSRIIMTSPDFGLIITPSRKQVVAFEMPKNLGDVTGIGSVDDIVTASLNIENMAVTVDGRRVAEIVDEKTVNIYDGAAFTEAVLRRQKPVPLFSLKPSVQGVSKVSLSGDGKYLFLANDTFIEKIEIVETSSPRESIPNQAGTAAKSAQGASNPEPRQIHEIAVTDSGYVSMAASGAGLPPNSITPSSISLPVENWIFSAAKGTRNAKFSNQTSSVSANFEGLINSASSNGNSILTFGLAGVQKYTVSTASGLASRQKISDLPVGFKIGAAIPDYSEAFVAIKHTKDRNGKTQWFFVRKMSVADKIDVYSVDSETNTDFIAKVIPSETAEIRMIDRSNGFVVNRDSVTAFSLEASGQVSLRTARRTDEFSQPTLFFDYSGSHVARLNPSGFEILDSTLFHASLLNGDSTAAASASTSHTSKITNIKRAVFSGYGRSLVVDNGTDFEVHQIPMASSSKKPRTAVRWRQNEIRDGTRRIVPLGDGDSAHQVLKDDPSDTVVPFLDGFAEFHKKTSTLNIQNGSEPKKTIHPPEPIAAVVSSGDGLTIVAESGTVAHIKDPNQALQFQKSNILFDRNTLFVAHVPGKDGMISSIVKQLSKTLGITTSTSYVLRLNSGFDYSLPPSVVADFKRNGVLDLRMLDESSGLIISKNRTTAFSLQSQNIQMKSFAHDGRIAASLDGKWVAWVNGNDVTLFQARDFHGKILSESSIVGGVITTQHGVTNPTRAVFATKGVRLFIDNGKDVNDVIFETQP